MNNIIWNPSEIRIPQNTLVALCGITNSGKTTLGNNKFSTESIISTDKILTNCIEFLVSSIKYSLDITPESSVWQDISQHLSRVAILTARDIMSQQLVSAQPNDITILDSVGISLEQRLSTLKFAEKYFEHIYLFVLHPSLEKVLEREPKIISENCKSLGFYVSTSEQISKSHLELKLQISKGTIAQNVEKAFIIENPNNIDIVF